MQDLHPAHKEKPGRRDNDGNESSGRKDYPALEMGCLEPQNDSTACQHIVSPSKAWRPGGLYAHDPEIRLAGDEVTNLGTEPQQRNSSLDVHSAAKLQRALVRRW